MPVWVVVYIKFIIIICILETHSLRKKPDVHSPWCGEVSISGPAILFWSRGQFDERVFPCAKF